jgi:1-acyl-sn-glycerol-3-phosphate acyltransferase
MSGSVELRPEEERAATIKRRLVSIPVVYLAFVAVTVFLIPALIVLGIWDVLMFVTKRRPPSGCRMMLILFGLLTADVIGIPALAITWLASGFGSNKQLLGRTAFVVQSKWAAWMMFITRKLFRLNIDVQGRDQASEGPYILLVRHSSMVDNLLPSHSISVPLGIELRYVMKRELLNDPCFDIAGKRLRNHFVDRDIGGPDEIARIRELATGMGKGDGTLIYPEGTRYTEKKRARALEKIAENNPARAERMAVLKQCLPPRLGGPLALLEGAPEADVVLLVHYGFDGLRGVGDVLRGDLSKRTVAVRLVRFKRSDIPAGDGAADWIDSLWIDVDNWVSGAKAAIERGEQAGQFELRAAAAA